MVPPNFGISFTYRIFPVQKKFCQSNLSGLKV